MNRTQLRALVVHLIREGRVSATSPLEPLSSVLTFHFDYPESLETPERLRKALRDLLRGGWAFTAYSESGRFYAFHRVELSPLGLRGVARWKPHGAS